ncbi:altered inheritance of mitochondria protein 21 [Lophiotrema nucula]|uniref:Altered inheritance of mitochondria protein 21 n=1 Tax=Lophiotrema nucula TaxID=690887 RepID=A0A6A5Z901_9PLEO|nr:altered inheritance of mitochondria protein 21 [Lophiotrema nucula]
MATPTIPPRPSRTQNIPPSSGNMDIPKIPPRPKRGLERSISPHRDAYARSPLNELPGLHKTPSNNHSNSNLSAEVPARPPSVTLPSIGQEGNEYASLEDLHKVPSLDGSPQQTSNVAGDLPLFAPRASVPSSTAKRQIQTVTRTDSSQAAAAISKLLPEQKSALGPDSGRSDASSGGRTRPTSILKDDDEHGIPEIGVQVPMYPNAGDVQAPTPSPYDQAPSVGVGFFNKGGQTSGRHHGRTKSGREIFHGPPGSYGLHGHGIIPNDDFEKKWYERHPEDLKREKAGEYGPHIQENRKDYHWVGDDLVKLVHSSGSKGVGLGTSREAVGTPDEHIGYRASEEYASRMASPRPTSGRPPSVHVDSPLKQQDFPADQLSRQQTHGSEAEEEVIHIDPPSHRASKVGGGGYDPPTEDLGPEGGNTEEEGGWVNERGYGVPILASDETRKNPGAEYRQPAVSPELERRADDYTTNDPDGVPSYVTKYRSPSRSSSRNNSVHGMQALSRVISPQEHHRSGTPLESTKEYEPLFPEDEEDKKKPKSALDKFKRPELARHHFPSQDVWEDTPSSLLHETTVETPQAPEEPQSPGEEKPSQVFETPDAEEARKDDITKEDQQSFLPEHTKRLAKSHINKGHLAAPTRPGMQQRFPSHDIWEDAPDHGHLETTVSGPQEEDTGEYLEDSPVVEKPSVPARPNIPSRPQKAKELSPVDKKAPVLPDRPKPQIPARPGKPLATQSSERVPTGGAENFTPQPKVKPGVPPRPAGSKIAALQSGFLKDLNSKLGLGPQAPKVKEPEPEKEEEPPKPLQDARKGRAKGPQRRKPASSPTPAAATVTAEVAVPPQKLEISTASTLWSIGDDGAVDVPAAQIAAKISSALKVSEREESIEQVEKPDVDVAEDIADKGDAIESEEADLAKTLTADSEVSQSSKAVGLEEDPETHIPSLEKKNSLDIPFEKSDSVVPEKTEPEAPVPQGVDTDEPTREKAELAEAVS